MKKMKRLATMLVAGLMASVMAFPSLARTYEYKTGSTEIIRGGDDFEYVSGHVRQYPSWVWVNGYCYYYQNRHLPEVLGNNYLKNCVTPDGYTVDEEGRWTENGVPQHNSYGSEVIGTDELYAGKNDDERWQIMRELTKNLFINNIEGTEYAVAMKSRPGSVDGYWTQEGYAHYGIIHDSDGKYARVLINNAWNDCPEEYILNKNETIEKLIKITCGDHVGQELFDDIRKAADPAGSAGKIIELDENGNLIWIDADHVKIKTIEHASNGVDFSLFDLNKWNGRQTDYGKTITIVPAEERHQWEIIIN